MKTSKPITTAKKDNLSADRILKIGMCPSLSGKSQLTYHVGCTANGEVLFRIFANSSSGYFNREWKSLSAIQERLDRHPEDKPLTSFCMARLFEGKSANSYGFLFAVLVAEGFAQHLGSTARSYERRSPEAFMAEVKALIDSGIALDPEQPATIEKPKKVRQKAIPVVV